MTRSKASLREQLALEKTESLNRYKAVLVTEQDWVNQRYEEFMRDRLAQKCLGFQLGFETGSMDSSIRPLPHPDSLFEAFKVDPSKFSEHAKPRLDAKSEDMDEDLEADPSS